MLRSKLSAVLLALVLALLALPARADFQVLNDQTMTPGTADDSVVIYALTTAVSVSSRQFVVTGNNPHALLTLTVSDCASCNLALRVEWTVDGTNWYAHTAFAAVTANGTTHYEVGGQPLGVNTILTQFSTALTAIDAKPLPAAFRVQATRVAGSATVLVTGIAW